MRKIDRKDGDNVADQAVSSNEAAAIMGVHRGRPAVMADRGDITSRPLDGAKRAKTRGERVYAIYDGEECDANFREYDETLRQNGGRTERRPRSYVHLRPSVLRYLSTVPRIDFSDAISVVEAARILHVTDSMVTRLVEMGRVVGRRVWSGEYDSPVMHIISRKSCLENVRQVKLAATEGRSVGRPRRFAAHT